MARLSSNQMRIVRERVAEALEEWDARDQQGVTPPSGKRERFVILVTGTGVRVTPREIPDKLKSR
jgi:hypothetical protein